MLVVGWPYRGYLVINGTGEYLVVGDLIGDT